MNRHPFLVAIAVAMLAALVLPITAQAANPATINVTVTIQNLSVTASGPIAFGLVTASSTTVSGDSSRVVNDGNTTETYSLNVTNPGGWTAVQAAPGAETYALSVVFNSVQTISTDFTYANEALTTTPVASSATKFAGDQTGLSVPAAGVRLLWFKFEAPTSTTVTTQQTMVVTLTAAAG